jgi:hypothetical protein
MCGPCGVMPTSGTSSGSASGTSSGATSGTSSGVATTGASGSSGAPAPGCSQYGQICTTASDCCSGLPCSSGRCGVLYIPR